MIKIEKQIHESASLVIDKKDGGYKTKDELVVHAYQCTPKKRDDPVKEQIRGSELNKDMRSRRNDSDIRHKEREDLKSGESGSGMVITNKSTAVHEQPRSKDNQSGSQTTGFNSKKTNQVTNRGGYKDNINLMLGTREDSIGSSPARRSMDFN